MNDRIYIVTKNGELYHYGVPGMKWGIRRSANRLQKKTGKLQRKTAKLESTVKELKALDNKYTSKSAAYQKHNSKYEARLAKATSKKAKYDIKLAKAASRRHIDTDKVGKLTAKSAKQQLKINKAQAKIKYNKWQQKADSVREDARKAQLKIEKNKKLMSTYNKTITAMDENKIKKGRVFMQYVRVDD